MLEISFIIPAILKASVPTVYLSAQYSPAILEIGSYFIQRNLDGDFLSITGLLQISEPFLNYIRLLNFLFYRNKDICES
jgi:hypothetical protein